MAVKSYKLEIGVIAHRCQGDYQILSTYEYNFTYHYQKIGGVVLWNNLH